MYLIPPLDLINSLFTIEALADNLVRSHELVQLPLQVLVLEVQDLCMAPERLKLLLVALA